MAPRRRDGARFHRAERPAAFCGGADAAGPSQCEGRANRPLSGAAAFASPSQGKPTGFRLNALAHPDELSPAWIRARAWISHRRMFLPRQSPGKNRSTDPPLKNLQAMPAAGLPCDRRAWAASHTIFSGRTVSSNSSAVRRPRANTASLRVVPSCRAFLAHAAARS